MILNPRNPGGGRRIIGGCVGGPIRFGLQVSFAAPMVFSKFSRSVCHAYSKAKDKRIELSHQCHPL